LQNGEAIAGLPDSSSKKIFFRRNQSHFKYEKLMKRDRNPIRGRGENFNTGMNVSNEKIIAVENDVRDHVAVYEPQIQGAASPPPPGRPHQKGEFPGDLQRLKRDSEKISRNENKKKLLYDGFSPRSGS